MHFDARRGERSVAKAFEVDPGAGTDLQSVFTFFHVTGEGLFQSFKSNSCVCEEEDERLNEKQIHQPNNKSTHLESPVLVDISVTTDQSYTIPNTGSWFPGSRK